MKFFGKIRWQRTCPFWVDEQLALRPEFTALAIESTSITVDETSVDLMSDSDSGSDSKESMGHIEEDLLTTLEEENPPSYNYPQFKSNMHRAMEISDEQEARGNVRFVQKFIESNASNQTLVEEIQQLNNRHTTTLTWARRRHHATMYYN